MLKAVKIRLKPTPEQEVLFWKSAGVARWSYNYYVGLCEAAYQAGEKRPYEGDVRKHINNTLKKTTHTWLKEVGSNVMKQAVKDADAAYKRYFKGLGGRPKFKTKHRSKISFYVNYESLVRKNGGFHGEKIGFVKTTQPLPKLTKGEKHYSNPRISYDGKYWYLSLGYEAAEPKDVGLTGETIGVDLGIKELAVCSNGMKFKNINKTRRVRSLEKRLRREGRKLSRKMEANTEGHIKRGKGQAPIWKRPLRECCNIGRQNGVVRRIHKKLTDIRTNHVHQTTAAIVKTKPSKVVLEDLNVKGMMKNRHLSRAVACEKFSEFRRQMEYKTKFLGIELVIADKFYPSSKKCSCCGHIKKDLKLKERTYVCPECGLMIDRDYNASINLANYGT